MFVSLFCWFAFAFLNLVAGEAQQCIDEFQRYMDIYDAELSSKVIKEAGENSWNVDELYLLGQI